MSFPPPLNNKNGEPSIIYSPLPSSHPPSLPDPIASTDPIKEEAISWRTKAWADIKNNFAAFASTVANGFSSIGNGIVAIGCSIFQFCFSSTHSSKTIEEAPDPKIIEKAPAPEVIEEAQENSLEADVKKANDFLTLQLTKQEEWIQRLNEDGLTRLFNAMTDVQKYSFLDQDLSDSTKTILVSRKIFDLNDFDDVEDYDNDNDSDFHDVVLDDPTKKLKSLDEAVFISNTKKKKSSFF